MLRMGSMQEVATELPLWLVVTTPVLDMLEQLVVVGVTVDEGMVSRDKVVDVRLVVQMGGVAPPRVPGGMTLDVELMVGLTAVPLDDGLALVVGAAPRVTLPLDKVPDEARPLVPAGCTLLAINCCWSC